MVTIETSNGFRTFTTRDQAMDWARQHGERVLGVTVRPNAPVRSVAPSFMAHCPTCGHSTGHGGATDDAGREVGRVCGDCGTVTNSRGERQ